VSLAGCGINEVVVLAGQEGDRCGNLVFAEEPGAEPKEGASRGGSVGAALAYPPDRRGIVGAAKDGV
jgi:hypothetical protein